MSYQDKDVIAAGSVLARREGDGATHAQIGRLASIARALKADAAAIQAQLSLAERRFQATFVHAPVGIAHVALDGSFLSVNPRFEEITGYPAQHLTLTGFPQITHPDDLDADMALLARLSAGEIQRYTMEKRYIRADDSCIWVNLTVAMVRDEAGAPEFYVAVIEDMSEIRKAQREAVHDPLTGLLNRRGLMARGERMVRRAAQDGGWLGVVYLDLDGFKALNDREGHSAGDRCLVDIARLLEEALRPQDIVARMGGDEFVMLLPDLSGDPAHDLVDRLRARLCATIDGISGSFGLVAAKPEQDQHQRLESLIRQADQAMLVAKRTGKNQVVVNG